MERFVCVHIWACVLELIPDMYHMLGCISFYICDHDCMSLYMVFYTEFPCVLGLLHDKRWGRCVHKTDVAHMVSCIHLLVTFGSLWDFQHSRLRLHHLGGFRSKDAMLSL